MKKYKHFAAILLVLTVATGAAMLQNPMYAAYYFSVAGANDADITVAREQTSGVPEISLQFTTSDVEEWVIQPDSVIMEGATANAYETTITAQDATADRTLTLPDYTGRVNVSGSPVAGGSAITLTAALYAGLQGCVALDTAAGTTVTLPAATGTGDRYCFLVTVTPTSNQHRIAVVGDDEFVGSAILSQDGGDTLVMFEAADGADNDHLNMNSSTQGGEVGDLVEIWDCLADNWCVTYKGQGSGTEATPFNTGQVS